MTVIGVLLCSIAVGFFKCSAFGVDPFQCFAMNSWGRIVPNMAYGTYYAVLSILLLILDFFLDKHYIGIATFINLFLTGYIVSFSEWVISYFFPEPGLPLRIGFLVFGLLLMCLSASLYMTADLGVSVYDAIPIVISNRTKFPFRFVRIVCDCICVAIGTACVLLGAQDGQMPGIGTIVTAFFMGPLVDFFNRTIAQPLLYGKNRNPANM